MMQTMRNSAKVIFIVVLVAFVGFMVYGGLMSVFASKNRGAGAPPGVVGTINGENIPYTKFSNALSARTQALYKDGQEPSEDDLQRVSNEVWNSITTITLIEQEAAKHGIAVTDAEVAQFMRQSPPKEITESKNFQTEGKFDMSKYQGWLQQMAMSGDPQMINILKDFEDQIRQQLLISRLQEFVLSMVRVTPEDVKNDFAEKNDKIKVKYITIPAGDYDSTITTVPDSEIKARYDKDLEQYKVPERAVISYVQFQRLPSDEDYADAKITIDEILKEIRGGADFATIAKEKSEDKGSGAKGGDLGWFGEGQMVPEFTEAVKKLTKIGEISEPVKTSFGWHIIKLTGKRVSKDNKPEFQASHILIKVEPSTETLSRLEQKADNLKVDAMKSGLKTIAEEQGLTVNETKPFAKGAAIPNLGPNQSLSDFAFNAKDGDISEVIPSRSAFLVAQLVKKLPAGYTPLEEAKDRIQRMILRDKRAELAQQRGQQLADEISSGKAFEQIAAESGKPVQETDFITRSMFIPKIGNDPDFIGASFSLTPANPVSKMVKSRSGAYIIKLVDHQLPDFSTMSPKTDSLRLEMINTKRKDLWSKWVTSLKDKAKIEDYRTS